MSIIPPHMILTDRQGHEWRTAPGYQDREVNAPGWLLLCSTDGVEMAFAEVVLHYGFESPSGMPYLGVRLELCGHCGRPLRGYASVYGVKVCHPDDGLDCYSLVTISGHSMPCQTLDADRRYCEAVDDFFDEIQKP